MIGKSILSATESADSIPSLSKPYAKRYVHHVVNTVPIKLYAGTNTKADESSIDFLQNVVFVICFSVGRKLSHNI